MKLIRLSIAICALLVAATASHAQDEERPAGTSIRRNLELNSPFIPPGWTPPQPRRTESQQPREAPPPPLKIEWRGVVDFGDGPRFGLHDPDRGRAFWIGLGEEYNGVSIIDYSDDYTTLVISHSGRNAQLKLSERSDTPVEVASAPQPAGAQAPQSEDNSRDARREAWRRRQEAREAQEGGPPPGAAQMREAFRNATPEEREVLWQRIGQVVQDFQSDQQNAGNRGQGDNRGRN